MKTVEKAEAVPAQVGSKWIVQDLGAHAGYPAWHSYAIRDAKTNVHLATVGGVDRYFEGRELEFAILMAAAPELLEELKEIVSAMDNWKYLLARRPDKLSETVAHNCNDLADKARGVITKAQGGAK